MAAAGRGMLPVMNEQLRERLFERLQALLIDHPQGLAEHELLAILHGEGIPLFAEAERHDPLEIFRRHFLLFHLLYGLRDRLRQRQLGDVAIHCLKIVLTPLASGESMLPAVNDPLRAYYLDLEQSRTTERQDVEAMLDRFWRLFAGHEQRDQALAVLGLAGTADRKAVKSRYRQLALEHHPDRGGDPERFRKVTAAADLLLGS